jgi:hypothetical protein
MLAQEDGKDSTVDVLKEWPVNKDRDLRERGVSRVVGMGVAVVLSTGRWIVWRIWLGGGRTSNSRSIRL